MDLQIAIILMAVYFIILLFLVWNLYRTLYRFKEEVIDWCQTTAQFQIEQNSEIIELGKEVNKDIAAIKRRLTWSKKRKKLGLKESRK